MPSRTLTPDLSATPGGCPDESAASPGLPRLRLITVPGGWPPYDCETHGAACPAARDAARTDLDVSGQAFRRDPAPDSPAGTGRPADSPAAAGVTTAWPQQFAQAVVEIMAGTRPPRQIVRWTTDRVRAQIGELTRLLASDQRPRIRRIVTSQPAASVVEMTVVVSIGPRSRALAMRFEHMPARQAAPGLPPRPARWLCTEIEAG